MTHTPNGKWMETYTGRAFNFINPSADDVCVEDVAHHLSQLNRYTGATLYPYTVAEHAIRVSRYVGHYWPDEPMVVMAALHHDSGEAYTGDISKPLKDAFKEIGGSWYKTFEARVDEAVREGLGLPGLPWHDPRIKEADRKALGFEAFYLLPSGGAQWDQDGWDLYKQPDLDDRVTWFEELNLPLGLKPKVAEQLFLTEHEILSEKIMEHYGKYMEAVSNAD